MYHQRQRHVAAKISVAAYQHMARNQRYVKRSNGIKMYGAVASISSGMNMYAWQQ